MEDSKPSDLRTAANEQFRALLEVSESISLHRDLSALFEDLARRLRHVVPFDYVSLVVHNAESRTMQLRILVGPGLSHIPPGTEWPVGESAAGLVWETQKPLVVRSLDEEKRFPRLMVYLREQGVASFCLVPLSTAQRRLGAMSFGSFEPREYQDEEVHFLERVARQVAVAADNALNYQRIQSYQQKLARERDRLRLLLDVTNAVVSHLDLRQLFHAISESLRRLLECEFVGLALYNPENQRMEMRALDFPAGKGFLQEEMSLPLDASPASRAFANRQPVLLSTQDMAKFYPEVARLAAAEGLRSGLALPLLAAKRALGTLNLASRREHAFSQEDVDFLREVAAQIAIAVENALAFQEIEKIKEKLAEEKLYLEDEIRSEHNFEEMVGESAAWKRVLDQVRIVAPTNSTVLILGETGTGKELIARAIHNRSGRRERTFVRMNCAAIPTGLLESELFGHEKGAFTGAIAKRIGRFELAHRGTLFLDEIGDIPLALQPKLLRVLQDQEFERLGGVATIRVDARLVAATNRDVAAMVAEGGFRSDLYYRLNIFPIHVPALRERPEDIRLLVRHFVQKHARELGRPIQSVPAEAMEAMLRYSWPGNIRELENFIERAIILSPGTQLKVPIAEFQSRGDAALGGIMTLEAAEREHIRRALAESQWIVGGARGAAARLGMKRTTLQSRMQKLGIRRSP